MKSLCLIPEGTHNRGTLGYGKVYEVSYIKRLDEFNDFAGSIDSRIIFLSYNKGIVYSDDDVSPYKGKNHYKIMRSDNNCKVLSLSLLKFCELYGVNKVYFLIDKLGPFDKFIKSIKGCGIDVELPYLYNRG